MIWLVLSLLTALSVAFRDIAVKVFSRELSTLEIGAAELFWSLPVLICAALLLPVPQVDAIFWKAFLISLPVNGLAYILYLHAIKLSPISLTVPFLAFTPVFMILTGSLVLGEKVSSLGCVGIILIVAGSYILNIDKNKKSFWYPITAFTREKGSWLMLLVAFTFSYAAVLGKQAMLHSSPLFFTYTFFIVMNLIMLIGFSLLGKTNWENLWSCRYKGFFLGSLLISQVSCHALAIMLNTAAYMIAVKRSSILFSVILSWLLLKEKNIQFRFKGTIIMFCGVILIALYG